MKTLYIRKSSSKLCDCGTFTNNCYSIIQDKKVKMKVCNKCVGLISSTLKSSKLVFVTFDFHPKIPKFLRRINSESKAA